MPVITTATGGTIELVNEVIVPQYDPEAIAANIKRLAENPDMCRRMGQENQKIIRKLYSPENLNILYDMFKEPYKPMKVCSAGGKIEVDYEAKAGRESLYSYK